MAATVTTNTVGRVSQMATLSAISVTISAASVSYATSLGGLAIDLASALINSGPQDYTPNPSDIIGFLPIGLSTLGFIPTGLTVGTPTYTAVSGASTQNSGLGALSTCPAYIRLAGSNATSSAKLLEIVDGVTTDSFTGLIVLARGGHNL